ncbi:MAG: hypothetical protein RIE73_14920 [Coleofasciculus sp. C1-SOL-03]
MTRFFSWASGGAGGDEGNGEDGGDGGDEGDGKDEGDGGRRFPINHEL